MTSPTEELPLDPHIYHHRVRDRTLLTIGAGISYLVFHFLGKLLAFPQEPGYAASIVQHSNSLIIFVIIALAFPICVIISSFITRIVHFDAGFYCACAGLAALSIRGGSMRYVLMRSSGPSAFAGLAMEVLVLYGIVLVGWWALLTLRDRNLIESEEQRAAPLDDEEAVPSQPALAVATQSMTMIFLMTIFTQTDQKAQSLVCVGLCAFLATLAAHSVFPMRPSIYFWSGPLIVALAGYLLACFGEGPWTTGEIYSYAPALARPLPLDYASAGPVGAILGYWASRRWHAIRQAEAETASPSAA